MNLDCKKLRTYFSKRLKQQPLLSIRVNVLFDDLNSLLHQYSRIDVFDLLVELILLADDEPARYLSALLAGLDDEVLLYLEKDAVSNAGAFIRDAMKQDIIRLQLQAYREIQKSKK